LKKRLQEVEYLLEQRDTEKRENQMQIKINKDELINIAGQL